MDQLKENRIYCNYCRRETVHHLRGGHSFEQKDDDSEWIRRFIYRFWICGGCGHATMEQVWSTPINDDLKGDTLYIFKFIPERQNHEMVAKSFKHIPKGLKSIYKETIKAYNNKLYILCAAGLRALIEGICSDKNILGKNLYAKIEGLSSFIPKNIVANLHSFRFIGNTALHELEKPDKQSLSLAIEVSQDLLTFLYELDPKTRQLADTNKSKSKNPEQQ